MYMTNDEKGVFPIWSAPTVPALQPGPAAAHDRLVIAKTIVADMLRRNDGRLVPMRFYLVELCELMTAHLQHGMEVEVRAPDLALPPRQAAALGTVALEAVLQALTQNHHGAPNHHGGGEQPGRVQVQLSVGPGGRLDLVVTDPAQVAGWELAQVDWTLLHSCIAVLDASLSIVKKPGDSCRIHLQCEA